VNGLKIPSDIVAKMICDAKNSAPMEVCGILAGRGGGVTQFYRMTNTDNSGEHFMMAPEEQFAVVKEIRERGLEVLGIYHSHPSTPARPSAEDIRLALTPEVTYVIVSLQDVDVPVLKGFLIEDGDVKEAAIEILEAGQ